MNSSCPNSISSCSARPAPARAPRPRCLTEDFGLPHIATGDMLRAAREAQTELGLLAEKLHGRGRAGARRGDHRDDPRAARATTTRATASCSTASRGRSSRPTRSGVELDAHEPPADRGAADRRARRARRAADLRPAHLPARTATSTTSTSTRPSTRTAATSTARSSCSATTTARRRCAAGSSVYHAQTEPLVAYYEERGPAAPLRRHAARPTQVHAHIRATLATLRLEEDAVIIRKTPEEIEKIAASGAILVRTLRAARAPGPPGRDDRRARRRGRDATSARRAACRRSRATAASRPRSAPRPTRWSCTGSRAPTRSSAAT